MDMNTDINTEADSHIKHDRVHTECHSRIDAEELRKLVPKQHRCKITNEFLDSMDRLITDPEFGDLYNKNIVTYTSVLSEGQFKLTDYFKAVAFVSHKLLGASSLSAYAKVFPDKIQRMNSRNCSIKDQHTYASAYNKNKLVTLIYQQTLMPDYIVYASIRHKAIAAQAALLSSPNQNIVQRAADSLLNHLKAPEQAKMMIEVGTKDGGVIADLANALSNLSKQQRGLIIEGDMNAKEIAHSPILAQEE